MDLANSHRLAREVGSGLGTLPWTGGSGRWSGGAAVSWVHVDQAHAMEEGGGRQLMASGLPGPTRLMVVNWRLERPPLRQQRQV